MTSRKGWPFALLIVAGLGVLAAKLALGPLYPRYTAAECQEAYATARTLADTNRVDLHPYDPARRDVSRRCGETRVTKVGSLLTPARP